MTTQLNPLPCQLSSCTNTSTVWVRLAWLSDDGGHDVVRRLCDNCTQDKIREFTDTGDTVTTDDSRDFPPAYRLLEEEFLARLAAVNNVGRVEATRGVLPGGNPLSITLESGSMINTDDTPATSLAPSVLNSLLTLDEDSR